MDYSVGSLADLITGSNTANKPRVIQKAFKKGGTDNLNSIKDNSVKHVNLNGNIKKPKKKVAVGNVLKVVSNKTLKKEGKKNRKDNTESAQDTQKVFKKKRNVKLELLSDDSNINEREQIKIENVKSNKKQNKMANVVHKEIKTVNNKSSDPEIPREAEIQNVQVIKKRKIKKLKLYKANGASPNSEGEKKSKGKKRKLETTSTDDTSDFVDNDNASDDAPPTKKEKLSEYQQNAERRVKQKSNKEKKVWDPEETSRTIFVGNVPINISKKKIKQHFKKYGKIESIRIRGIPVADPKTSKKVAAIKKEFNPNRSNVYCYIRFINKEDALKAEAENGAIFEDHHLRVHSCETEDKPDETKAIFVGNLSFDAVEDELWNLFESCGPISYVRIVRDSYTGMGKGFAYVNFKDSDAVQLALEMENVKHKDRELRISLCNLNMGRKNKKLNKKRKISQPGKQKFRKNFTKNSDKQTSNTQNIKTGKVNGEFQGSKFNDKKKKYKINKGVLEKKKLVKKIAPKIQKE